MRRAWIALPVLLLLGCEGLNPAVVLQEAARQLRFSLDRVEPRLELAFPLENSRLHLGLVVGVENPSGQRLKARSLSGDLALTQGGVRSPLGKVTFPEGLDLQPKGRGTVKAELSFGYRELKAAWDPLSRAVVRKEAATWHLDGEAQLEAFGIPFRAPFHATKGSGN